ncbi:MAG TPA: RNA polymerase sigma factor [Polyangiaceae bacterium]|jgi:RNA polymerase sigma-70 factor (ECF subfamily)|nr:RNA polymerase sigma factor [Polyangiaceae bacterium]
MDDDTSLGKALEAALPRLHAQARRLCWRESDAHDLVQETVLRALVYEASFERGTNLHAWLAQIQRSIFVSRFRRAQRERRALERLGQETFAWPHRDPTPSAPELGPRVQEALRELPVPFRTVIELVDLGGREYLDAAAELAVPVGTVMSRLYRGRRILAARLADREQQHEPRRAA